MKDHLKSAVKRYKQEEVRINPISNLDVEIVVELTQIFDKLNQPELKSMVDQWKFLSDVEVRDMLIEWNIQHPKTFEEKGEEGEENGEVSLKISREVDIQKKRFTVRDFIDFRGEVVEVGLIKTIGKSYSLTSNGIVFEIIFNKDLHEKFVLINKVFKFMDERIRDQHYEDLKERLQNVKGVTFI